jgi:hypothetical protein
MLILGVVVLLILIVISSGASIMMKVQLNDELPEDEQFPRQDRDWVAVTRKYRQLYPDSYLPDIARYTGWGGGLIILVFALSRWLAK